MEPITVKNWDDLYNLYREKFYPLKDKNKPEPWLFRGDSPEEKYSGKTSFLDALKSKIDKDFEFFDIKEEDRLFREKCLFRDFCRKQFLYTNYQPKSEIEKLTLMRHHEGPTRLMDWTYSFLVAVYFAINKAKHYCVVWAIDEKWMECERKELHRELRIPNKPLHKDNTWYNEEVLKKFWGENTKRYKWIYPMTSFFLNKRLTLQRGTFLCQADIRYPWYENFKAMRDSASHMYQINIKWDEIEKRNEIINMLFEMNINQATLFQDLDGLAISLRTKLASPQCFPYM